MLDLYDFDDTLNRLTVKMCVSDRSDHGARWDPKQFRAPRIVIHESCLSYSRRLVNCLETNYSLERNDIFKWCYSRNVTCQPRTYTAVQIIFRALRRARLLTLDKIRNQDIRKEFGVFSIYDRRYCHVVYGCVTNNNWFWIKWLHLSTPCIKMSLNHNQLQELTINLQSNPSSLTAEYSLHSRSRSTTGLLI
jgi:hypothetical protein